MKKYIALMFIVSFASFIAGCSKDGDDSSDDKKTTAEAPAAPTQLTLLLTGFNEVSLTWKDNSANEAGFKIERKTQNGIYKQVGIVGENVTTFKNNGLITDSTYTYRVVAYNNAGTSAYTNTIEVTMYTTVTVGGVTWMKENLNVEYYRNGDIIPQVTDPNEWANLTTGAWCYYQNKSSNGVTYGKLYNWYAVNDPRGLAPTGWHVATKAEWVTITDFLGGETVAGGPMKSMDNWTAPNTGATNSSGFTAVGGGARIADAAFSNLGVWGSWWTADQDTEGVSFYRILYNNSTKSEGYHIYNSFGMSVRYVQNK